MLIAKREYLSHKGRTWGTVICVLIASLFLCILHNDLKKNNNLEVIPIPTHRDTVYINTIDTLRILDSVIIRDTITIIDTVPIQSKIDTVFLNHDTKGLKTSFFNRNAWIVIEYVKN